MLKAGVYVSDRLFTSAGATTSGLVVEPSQENFELVIGRDLSTFQKQDADMNLQCKVFEVLAPRIKRPTSICELTGFNIIHSWIVFSLSSFLINFSFLP